MGRQFDYVSRLLTVNVFKRDVIEAQAMVHYYNHCHKHKYKSMFSGRYVRVYLGGGAGWGVFSGRGRLVVLGGRGYQWLFLITVMISDLKSLHMYLST